MFDILFAAAGIVLLVPVGVIITIAIVLDDGWPVFFRQVRIGRGGRPFRMWKFRTMVNRPRSSRVVLLSIGADPRITRSGRWLRRLKLDELPQLINVLRGEMSLVGPRPEVARYVELYPAEQRRVLELVPGITDPASIRYRREAEILAHAADPERTYIEQILPDKLRLNLAYAERATVWSDVGVILRTLVPVGGHAEPSSAGWTGPRDGPVVRRRRRFVQ